MIAYVGSHRLPPSHAIYVEIGRKGGVGYGQANNNAITGIYISSNSTKIVKL